MLLLKSNTQRNKDSLVSNGVEPALTWFTIHHVFVVRTTPGGVGRAPVVGGCRRLPQSLHKPRVRERFLGS